MSEQCLYEKIGSDIKELISSGRISQGEKIPSVSDIRKKYSVSHITALRVLQELSDSGHVEFIKGKGYFARTSGSVNNSPALKGSIGCILRPSWKTNPYDNFFNDINQAVQNEAMKRKFNLFQPYCNIELLAMTPDERALDLIKETCLKIKEDVDGFLMDERIPDQYLRILSKELGKPVVLVGRKSALDIDSVAPDNENGSAKAAELCIKMGYKSFLIGKNQLLNPNSIERTEAFTAALEKNGINKNMIKHFDFNIVPYEETLSGIKKIFQPGVKTLIFSPSDSFARALADLFDSEKIILGVETGIISIDGLGCSRVRKPFLTTVDVKPELIGSTAVAILAGRINKTNFSRPGVHVVESEVQLGDTI